MSPRKSADSSRCRSGRARFASRWTSFGRWRRRDDERRHAPILDCAPGSTRRTIRRPIFQFRIFRSACLPVGDPASSPRVGVAIGDQVIDLAACGEAGLFDAATSRIVARCAHGPLNELMRLGRDAATQVRSALSRLMAAGGVGVRSRTARCIADPRSRERMRAVGSGAHRRLHRLLRVGVSRDERRQHVSARQPTVAELQVGADRLSRARVVDRVERDGRCGGRGDRRATATRALRHSVRVGGSTTSSRLACSSGPGNTLAIRFRSATPSDHVFGLCLVNDWSARDIQAWEYQPLGPFLAKNFATTDLAVGRDARRARAVSRCARSSGRPATPRRCRTCTPPRTTRRAASRSRSRCCSRRRRCVRAASRRFA